MALSLLEILFPYKLWLEKFRKNKKFRLLTIVCFALLIVLVAVAIILVWKARQSSLQLQMSDNQDVSDVITTSTDSPSEIPPCSDYVWKGQLDDPKYIHLPSVSV